MEEMIKPRTCDSTSLSMHKESHAVTKFKPKIRIVHIIAPEIIKTDVANFRELVQRLTGKPGGRKCGRKRARDSSSDISEREDVSENAYCNSVEARNGFRNLGGCGERVKEEEETWGDGNSDFFDLDGFIHGLSEFPLVSLGSSHMDDAFGEAHLS